MVRVVNVDRRRHLSTAALPLVLAPPPPSPLAHLPISRGVQRRLTALRILLSPPPPILQARRRCDQHRDGCNDRTVLARRNLRVRAARLAHFAR